MVARTSSRDQPDASTSYCRAVSQSASPRCSATSRQRVMVSNSWGARSARRRTGSTGRSTARRAPSPAAASVAASARAPGSAERLRACRRPRPSAVTTVVATTPGSGAARRAASAGSEAREDARAEPDAGSGSNTSTTYASPMVRSAKPSTATVSTMPPPVEVPTSATLRPERPVSTNFMALGWSLSVRWVNSKATVAPASAASSKARNRPTSSGPRPSTPATMARSSDMTPKVPAKEPRSSSCMRMSAAGSPSRSPARRPSRQGAAVCELEPGCMTGPKTSLKSSG